jgi:hypothetical protein
VFSSRVTRAEPFHSSFLELSDSISCLIGRMKPLYFLFGYEMILTPFDTVKMSAHMVHEQEQRDSRFFEITQSDISRKYSTMKMASFQHILQPNKKTKYCWALHGSARLGNQTLHGAGEVRSSISRTVRPNSVHVHCSILQHMHAFEGHATPILWSRHYISPHHIANLCSS